MNCTVSRTVFPNAHMEYHEVKLPTGKEVVLGDLKGPGKVTYWYITDDSNGKFYPGLVLKVFWDGEAAPSINVPLSDFFGAIGSHTIDYQSVPMQIQHFCYMCYLPMPFSKRPGSSWPTTATRIIGKAWLGESTTKRASSLPGRRAGCAAHGGEATQPRMACTRSWTSVAAATTLGTSCRSTRSLAVGGARETRFSTSTARRSRTRPARKMSTALLGLRKHLLLPLQRLPAK